MFQKTLIGLLLAGILMGARGFGAWETVFHDDFDGPSGLPDSTRWIVNHPESWWWVQGRTFFPSPVYHPEAPFPRQEAGECVIEHHLYNAYHLGTPKTTFLGGEIRTVVQFAPSETYRFEARVRSGSYADGLVTSFFTYGYDGSRSDEIDFEFLSNKTNDEMTYPEGDPLLTNPWDESSECPQLVRLPGLDLTEWNTFRIYWNPGESVEWTWLNQAGREMLLRRETASCLPDEPMSLYFNFWAAASTWPGAYDSELEPVQSQNENVVYSYAIDRATVCIFVVSIPGDLDGDGLVNSTDLDIVRANWGESVPSGDLASGDVSGDGVVNSADLDVVRAHWGTHAAVPEPCCLLLLSVLGYYRTFMPYGGHLKKPPRHNASWN